MVNAQKNNHQVEIDVGEVFFADGHGYLLERNGRLAGDLVSMPSYPVLGTLLLEKYRHQAVDGLLIDHLRAKGKRYATLAHAPSRA